MPVGKATIESHIVQRFIGMVDQVTSSFNPNFYNVLLERNSQYRFEKSGKGVCRHACVICKCLIGDLILVIGFNEFYRFKNAQVDIFRVPYLIRQMKFWAIT